MMAGIKSALAIGTTVRSDKRTYIIRKVLGQGGFGITYLAESQVNNSGKTETIRVALKEHFISSLCSRNDVTNRIEYSSPVADEVRSSLKTFLREAVRLRELGVNHPNIVKIDEVFQANNTAYYAMELLEDGTLADRVKSSGPMRAGDVLKLFEPLIAAVATLHSNKIAHYDIKPANIMLRREWNGAQTPVLIDFGLAKHYDNSGQATSTLACAGYSTGYAPMEQYRGIREFSPACDVYAIGATMYYCLTGRTPLDAFDVQLDIVERELLPIAGRNLTDIIVKALADKIQNRTPNAGMLYNSLYHSNTTRTINDFTRKISTHDTKIINPKATKKNSNKFYKYTFIVVLIATLAAILSSLVLFTINSANEGHSAADTIAADSALVDPIYDSVGIAATATDAITEAAAISEDIPSPAEITAFVKGFKKKFWFEPWEPIGDPDENGQGECDSAIFNESGVTLDGSDYKVIFKYAYLYSDPPEILETVTKKGQTLRPGGSMTIKHYYSDDCSPLSPQLVFTISDEEIYRKYHTVAK